MYTPFSIWFNYRYGPYVHFGYWTLISDAEPNMKFKKLKSNDQKVPKQAEAKRDNKYSRSITESPFLLGNSWIRTCPVSRPHSSLTWKMSCNWRNSNLIHHSMWSRLGSLTFIAIVEVARQRRRNGLGWYIYDEWSPMSLAFYSNVLKYSKSIRMAIDVYVIDVSLHKWSRYNDYSNTSEC